MQVNDKLAPAESVVFVGDTIRTSEARTAIFTMSGNGTLKIEAQSQVVISGEPEFSAELQSGTAVIDSINCPSGIKLRVGNFAVVPAVRFRVTPAKAEAQPGGTFQVTCLDGDISTPSCKVVQASYWKRGNGSPFRRAEGCSRKSNPV